MNTCEKATPCSNSNKDIQIDCGSTVFSLQDLMKLKFQEQSWVVEDWIPEGLIMIAGRPKIGKSLMALDLALSVSSSGYFLKRECARKKVLFFPLEDHPRRIQHRLKVFEASQDSNIDFCLNLEYKNNGISKLKKLIDQTNAEVVFIDTLSKLLLGIDQNDHIQMVSIFGELNKLTQSMGISLIIVDHHRKSKDGVATDPIEDLFGSTGKTSQVDTCIGLYKTAGDKFHTLKIASRDNTDIELKIHRNPKDLRWNLVDDPNNIQPGSRKDKILIAIAQLSAQSIDATVTSISEMTSIDKSNISHDLTDLCIREIIKKGKKNGKEQPYFLSDKEINKTSE